jgi:hypothetical protein
MLIEILEEEDGSIVLARLESEAGALEVSPRYRWRTDG